MSQEWKRQRGAIDDTAQLEAERVFFSNISEHADGERRGPVAGLKAAERCVPPRPFFSDATLPIRPGPSAFAVGMRRKVAKNRFRAPADAKLARDVERQLKAPSYK